MANPQPGLEPLKCPKCKLMNPASAQRCDCGYDFVSRKVEVSYLAASKDPNAAAYADASRPAAFAWFIGIATVLLAIRGAAYLSTGDRTGPVISVVGLAVYWALYFGCAFGRSNAARIALIILAFPLGLMLATTRCSVWCLRKPT